MNLTLEDLLGDATLRLPPTATVRIWSNQWGLFWRANGAGYTELAEEAGLYSFADAWKRSSHCGPEKGIEYILVNMGLDNGAGI